MGLVRTPQGHQQSSWRTPVLKPSSNFGLPIAWITAPATDANLYLYNSYSLYLFFMKNMGFIHVHIKVLIVLLKQKICVTIWNSLIQHKIMFAYRHTFYSLWSVAANPQPPSISILIRCDNSEILSYTGNVKWQASTPPSVHGPVNWNFHYRGGFTTGGHP